jgi:hypothetical protein
MIALVILLIAATLADGIAAEATYWTAPKTSIKSATIPAAIKAKVKR